jgi:hypothetical protein
MKPNPKPRRRLADVVTVPGRMRILAAAAASLAIAGPAAAQVGGMAANATTAGTGARGLAPATTTRDVLQGTLGATYSDNIARTTTNEQSDTFAKAGILADLARTGTRIDYDLVADLDWVKYIDNTYSSQPYGSLDGHLDFAFVPDRFFWDVRESYTQSLIDPSSVDTPANNESINYLTTGPRLELPLGTQTSLSLYGTYSDVHYSSRDAVVLNTDNNRYVGGLGLTRSLSDSSSAFIEATSEKVEFDDASNGANDYKRQEAYVGYRMQAGRTSVDIQTGANRLEGIGSTSTGFLARMELARMISPTSIVALTASQQVADSADQFRSGFDQGASVISPTQYASNDPFRERTVGGRWSYTGSRMFGGLSYTKIQDRYQTQIGLDRNSDEIGGNIRRRITPTLDLRLDASYRRDRFLLSDVDNKNLNLTLSAGWQAGRKLQVLFELGRYDRNSNDGLSDYTENRFGVTLSYALTTASR